MHSALFRPLSAFAISGHCDTSTACPLIPQKQTYAGCDGAFKVSVSYSGARAPAQSTIFWTEKFVWTTSFAGWTFYHSGSDRLSCTPVREESQLDRVTWRAAWNARLPPALSSRVARRLQCNR